PPAPTYFHKPTSALVGHGGAVVRPANCKYLNYEGEVAIVIGRTCRGVPAAQAGGYIAGDTIGNDFGLHDFRDNHARSVLRVKGSDTMAPLGPGLVTGWDFRGKRVRTYVNGNLVQDGSTDEMHWDMHYLVADIARTITLYPGDVLLSGTPAGSRPVRPGDVVEVEVDVLGRLRNHIVAGPLPVPGDLGAQPTESEEVRSTALGRDSDLRGIPPPRPSSRPGAASRALEPHGLAGGHPPDPGGLRPDQGSCPRKDCHGIAPDVPDPQRELDDDQRARPSRAGALGPRGRGRRVRLGDDQRAHRAGPVRRGERGHGQPARVRPAREPGPGDAVAELARAAVRDRGGDHPDPAGRRGGHRAATAPTAAGPGAGLARPAQRGQAGGAAHGVLAGRGVRGAGR